MKNRNIKLMTLDAIASASSLLLAFLLRFDFSIPNIYIQFFKDWLFLFIFIQVLTFYFSGLYARIWRYTSLFDLYAIIKAVFLGCMLSTIYVLFSSGPDGYPRSILLIYLILDSLFTIIIRLSVRIYFSHFHQETKFKKRNVSKKILLLIGAGKTGEKICREIITTSRDKYGVVGFVDDDLKKKGALLHGKQIFGNIEDILNLNIKYDEILITAPSASGNQIRRIIEICKQTGKKYKTIPAIDEIIGGEISLDLVRDVSYSDLLGREEVKLDLNSIEDTIKDKRVLITGAGGSIGSELVKQCLPFNPAEIICLDISEENIYKLEQSFSKNNKNIIFKTVLASINIKNECEKVFIENRPQIVFHAAAYKHVPIQELHPWNAVNTNVGGTLNIVELSDKFLVDKFVLVSTDKAVNPVNFMGATKRTAEKLIQSYNSKSKTAFMAVRFGNVLGSSGSAIPTFQKQINEGGPITITHPEMTRYFMSIQEASQLILQSAALGKDGEIFLLKMGKPIRILQLAKDLIRLSGLEPEVDIPIVYTGLRPGEKLYEELQLSNERRMKTSHKKIMILRDNNKHVSWRIFKPILKNLLQYSINLDPEIIQKLLQEILPTYVPRNLLIDIKEKKQVHKIKAEA